VALQREDAPFPGKRNFLVQKYQKSKRYQLVVVDQADRPSSQKTTGAVSDPDGFVAGHFIMPSSA
jgi:hypothetical protein